MAATLTAIQDQVRELAREGDLDLTLAVNLALVNRTYRTMAAMHKWPELRRVTAFAATTTAGTSAYTFPTSVKYTDITGIEMEDPEDDLKYKIIPFSQSELDWNAAGLDDDQFPRVVMMQHDGTNLQTAFRPAPDVTALAIRAIGYIEPTALTVGGSTTIWYSATADDVLAYFIAASFQAQKNDMAHAQFLLARASTLISPLIGREVTPAELKEKGLLNA